MNEKQILISRHKFFGIFSVLGLYSEPINAEVKECTSSKDCDSETVCKEGICQKCLDCNILYRKGTSCKLDFSDCGDCLEGYEDTSVSRFSQFSTFLKFCTPIKIAKNSHECSENKDCMPDGYCLLESCVKCFNCSLYNRLPPVGGCAKHLGDCGSCITGYYEVPVTTKENTKPCGLVTSSVQKHDTYISSTPSSILLGFFVICLMFFASSIYVLQKNKSKSKICRTCQPIVTPSLTTRPYTQIYQPSAPLFEPPPYYSTDLPSQVQRKLIEEESANVICVNENTQNARVYQEPTAPYYKHFYTEERNDVSSESDSATEANSNLGERNNVPLHDNAVDVIDAVERSNEVDLPSSDESLGNGSSENSEEIVIPSSGSGSPNISQNSPVHSNTQNNSGSSQM